MAGAAECYLIIHIKLPIIRCAFIISGDKACVGAVVKLLDGLALGELSSLPSVRNVAEDVLPELCGVVVCA